MRQQVTNPPCGGGQLKLCANTLAPFSRNGNISVADCMPLSSLLKTIKINGGRWCMKNSRLSTSIWSITARSNVLSTFGRYASYCVDDLNRSIDALHTNAALPSNSGSRVYHRRRCKNAIKSTYFLFIMDSLEQLLPRDLLFRKPSSS